MRIASRLHVIRAKSTQDIVQGFPFEIPDAQRRQLDCVEGYGHGYDHATIELQLPDGATRSALALRC
jgi:hypothetical protein